MAPIYLCSIVAIAIFVRKALELRAARLGDVRWLPEVVRAVEAGDWERVEARCAATPHPASRVIEAATATWRVRPERAEAEGRRVGSLELQRLEKHLGALSFIAQVAPLLGLLGTVIGMVQLFLGLQGAGLGNVDAAMLASGIWKALLTTAAGLIVAVPALAAHTWLTSRTDRLRLLMGDVIEQLLTVAPASASVDRGGAALRPIEDPHERAGGDARGGMRSLAFAGGGE